jgi:hypothetical protein
MGCLRSFPAVEFGGRDGDHYVSVKMPVKLGQRFSIEAES